MPARTTRRTLLAAAGAAALALLAACGTADASAGGGRVALVAYSTPKDAYAEIIPAFLKTAAGKGLTFSQSYGASGAQSRAIAAGLPTDVAALSLAPDITKLVDAGLVAENWDADAHHGFVTRSVVVLVVRKGNPKGIHGWDDLVKPGVKVVTPNPLSSGGARWNVLAAYGAQLKAGRTHDQALAYLEDLFGHVVAQDAAAATSLQTFTAGVGDVLISYENEAIAARTKGKDVDWVVPDATILIENPVAVATRSANPQAAKAFVDFLRARPAQEVFAKYGYRPVVEGVSGPHPFPTPKQLFTIGDLGGWNDVSTRFFDPRNGLIVPIEKAVGASGG
jgi:sulfate/thiosulfate transport system substrate-binding protein